MNKNILVIGSGAIASFYSAFLAKKTKITMLCRSDYDVVKANGIKVESHIKNLHFYPQVIKHLNQYDDQADYLIIATKALPGIDLVGMVKELKFLPRNLVLIQNGIHIEQKLHENFSQCNLISALAFVAVSRISSGIIKHFDYGKLIIGNYPNKINEDCQQLIDLFRDCNVEVEASENIIEQRWKKLIWNGAFNPVSVLTGGYDTKKLLDNPFCKDLLQKIMKEIIALARLDGFNLDDNLIDKNFELTYKMKPYKTSMLLDFEAKRPMEIEAILGNAISFAKSKSVTTPYLSTLYALLSCY
jgi:2-dehydropantoate 2-reductase